MGTGGALTRTPGPLVRLESNHGESERPSARDAQDVPHGRSEGGHLFAGLLGGAGCAILASLCNMDAPYRSDCTKFALIGLGIRIALSVVGYIAMLPLLALPY